MNVKFIKLPYYECIVNNGISFIMAVKKFLNSNPEHLVYDLVQANQLQLGSTCPKPCIPLIYTYMGDCQNYGPFLGPLN